MSDVLLYHTTDNGEINVVGGIIELTNLLDTAVYLSLFGGNEDDTGTNVNKYEWWGNLSEVDTLKRYRSETQNILQSLPLTTSSLRKIEDAVNRDLSWIVSEGFAQDITISATMPSLNRASISILVDSDKYTFDYMKQDNKQG